MTDPLEEMPALRDVVARACAAAPSVGRQRQIRATGRELARALRHPEHPCGPQDELAEVLALPSLRAYERLALAGDLRARGGARPTTEATAQVRSGAVVLLQRAAGLPVAHLRPSQQLPGADPVEPARAELMRDSLARAADHAVGDGASTVRMLAMAAVVLDSGARVGELCSMRVEDLSPTLDAVLLERRPQNRGRRPPVREVFRIRDSTRVAVMAWLGVRQHLMTSVQGAQGAQGALWVSIRGNHRGPTRLPAGMPLQARGAGRAWVETVEELNRQLAGTPGWTPLPTRMEQLRRGVPVEPEAIVPAQPDAEEAALHLERLRASGAALAAVDETAVGERHGVRAELEAAWRAGLPHQLLQEALTDGGLAATDLSRAGWPPALLRALD